MSPAGLNSREQDLRFAMCQNSSRKGPASHPPACALSRANFSFPPATTTFPTSPISDSFCNLPRQMPPDARRATTLDGCEEEEDQEEQEEEEEAGREEGRRIRSKRRRKGRGSHAVPSARQDALQCGGWPNGSDFAAPAEYPS
eukprot:755789-Hanusia_phi.AAC.2